MCCWVSGESCRYSMWVEKTVVEAVRLGRHIRSQQPRHTGHESAGSTGEVAPHRTIISLAHLLHKTRTGRDWLMSWSLTGRAGGDCQGGT